MINKWNIMRTMVSMSIIILGLFQLFGIIENAIEYIIPLFGINLLFIYFQDKKENPTNATLSICIAIFAFIVPFLFLFIY